MVVSLSLLHSSDNLNSTFYKKNSVLCTNRFDITVLMICFEIINEIIIQA